MQLCGSCNEYDAIACAPLNVIKVGKDLLSKRLFVSWVAVADIRVNVDVRIR